MSDKLNPIRRLYAEPPDAAGRGPEELGPDEAAEVAALRPIREALDRLPAVRPAPEVIDEVVAAATFQAIRSLYGEAAPAPAGLPSAAADEAISLAPVKAALEKLPAESPDPEVVDEVVAVASGQAVRSLYREGDAQQLPRAAAHEAKRLAPVKQALEHLPREKPEPVIIEEVVAAATAQAVRSLYGEGDARSLPPAAAREAARLAPVKDALEKLPSERPDPRAIDAIMAAAAGRRVRLDRAPRERGPARRPLRRLARLAGTLAAIALVALAALWVMQEQPVEQLAVVEPRPERPEVAPESQHDALVAPEPERRGAEPERRGAEPERRISPDTPPRRDRAAESPSDRAAPAPQVAAAVPSAARAPGPPPPARTVTLPPSITDELSDGELAALTAASADIEASQEALRLLYLRLEALQEESQLLGAQPALIGAGMPVRPAASHGWMQVRIDR